MRGQIKKFLFSYFILIGLFLTGLWLTCLIPSSLMTKNINTTIKTLKKEGSYPTVGFIWRPVVWDNFTDALMLNTAYSVDAKTPFKSAMLNIRYQENLNEVNQIVNLEKNYLQQTQAKAGYERYWHGYLIFLRPLLVFFPYLLIRKILSGILFLTTGLYLYLIGKKISWSTALVIFLGLNVVDFFFIHYSLSLSGIFLLGMWTGIYLLIKRPSNYFLFFFIFGGLTSFFDLLSAPLVGLGLTLTLVVKLEKKPNVFLNCLFWAIGYLLFWSSKWLIVSVFFAPEAINTSLNQIVNRTVNQADSNFSQWRALQLNLLQLIGYSRFNRFLFLSFNILFFVSIFRYLNFSQEKIQRIFPWLMLFFLPYVWYLVVANHSYLHCWFSYRDQLISIVSLFFILKEFFNWQLLKKDGEKIFGQH